MRWLLALTLVPGCAFYEPRTCELDRELEARLGGEILDCGSSVDAPVQTLWDAHDCVLRAASSRTPFLVRWQTTGFEGAIIRAYGRFERALAAARAPRAAWQTPAEFMRTTLARLPVPAAPVRRLTALFEVARFSTHPLGAEARDAACDSLDEIGTALEEDAARER